jgi:soluble lytic murein transglycosylase-like protein
MKLHRVVVTPENADVYRDSMRDLLNLSAERLTTDAGGVIDARYRPMFPTLVKAAAWQESCWRQFVVVRGRLRWLESSTGDIGLMQVNKHVWRGFYSLEHLRWDVLYNAGAGIQILARMLAYVAARRKDDPVSIDEHTARSVYAAYNGGPGSYNRWRGGKTSQQERKIDALFLEKYRAVRAGESIDILSCAKDWGR